MKFSRIFILLAVSMILSCGGDDEKKTSSSSNTDGSQTTPLAVLAITGANPVNGNGVITVTSVTSNVNPSGGDQVIRITGTTGDQGAVKHQIDVHYEIYYVGMETHASVKQAFHAWGSTLQNSLDGGISQICTAQTCTCGALCGSIQINPDLNTIVFANRVLDGTSTPSTIAGTVVYP